MSRLNEKLKLLNSLHRGGKKYAKKKLTFPDELLKNNPGRAGKSPELVIKTEEEHFRKSITDGGNLSKSIPHLLPDTKSAGDYLHLTRDVSKFWVSHNAFMDRAAASLTSDSIQSGFSLAARQSDLLFLDIETCGFAGNPVFLIGVGYFKNGALCLEQYFARDYSEERNILEGFIKTARDYKILVTFNGKRFDWPFLEERFGVHLITSIPVFEQLDLYLEARKQLPKSLPDYKLQTLEKIFCLRERADDLPGSEIPAAYFEFVDNPVDFGNMTRAIHHNALDIITTVELLLVILSKGRVGGAY